MNKTHTRTPNTYRDEIRFRIKVLRFVKYDPFLNFHEAKYNAVSYSKPKKQNGRSAVVKNSFNMHVSYSVRSVSLP